ncbi:MAG: glucose-6-phosphate isomerase [Alicyclobacillaceae bacterium]|nr:glucose-6-phosphate isomerase [Alicyclobacillaceae bacterium]
MIRVRTDGAISWVSEREVDRLGDQFGSLHQRLWDRTRDSGKKGWLYWPQEDHEAEWQAVEQIAEQFRSMADAAVIVGIGGSYLGARAALSMLRPVPEWALGRDLLITFAGHQLSEEYLARLITALDDREVAVVVISKSGSTLEPAAAFHLLRGYLERRYGQGAKERICVITDPESSSLLDYARERGYALLSVPPNIGGRYSVLTAVGMLPMALAGIDIRAVMRGARQAWEECQKPSPFDNASYLYAACRHLLYLQGFTAEALVTYEPRLGKFAEWWQQLFGESHGKNGKGLFPTVLRYTTDLHSLGQYVQDGRRLLFETVLHLGSRNISPGLVVPGDVDRSAQRMAGRRLADVQEEAVKAVMEAHRSGGVPNLLIEATGPETELFGELVFFFEVACAMGGYLLAVDPFDQPGVEAYKRELDLRLAAANDLLNR